MIGFIALLLAFVITGSAVFSYFNLCLARADRPAKCRCHGPLLYNIAAAFIIVAAVYLMVLILTDQFQYAYVFGYSSRDLSLGYKISAFWAGQEGSFMLWLVFQALLGVILARRPSTPAATMAVYGIIQMVLVIILLAKSPFMILAGQRADGAGLNPLLQDPWMVIHPPIIFLGYAGLAIPFAYATGGLLTNEHRSWLRMALPWTLLAWSALGVGIFIGGFWAYKVLGWGGYWAWDPVENSSLVPWLACGVLLHFMLVAQVRQAAVKGAYLSAIFSFVLVLYGTFLTRSGILSDFSTHSFSDEGMGVLLAALVMLVAAAALVLLIIKWPKLPAGDVYEQLKSREFTVVAGALSLAVLAVVVLVGMSTPLVTMLLGRAQNVSAAFYNTMSLPLVLCMLAFLTLSPMQRWGTHDFCRRKNYWWLMAVGFLGLAGGVLFNIRHPLMLLVLAAAAAAGGVNLFWSGKGLSRSAGIAHTGVALLVIGVIISSAASQSVHESLEPGQTRQVLGRDITYRGVMPLADGKGFLQTFQIGDKRVSALTKLNAAGRPAAREPGIYREAAGDLYFAPLPPREDGTELVLNKGEKKTAEGLTIKFNRFGMMGDNPRDMRVLATLEIQKAGISEEADAALVYDNGRFKSVPVRAFDAYEISLTAINMVQSQIRLEIRNLASGAESGRIDTVISRKPLIGLVWLGALLITAGQPGQDGTGRGRNGTAMTIQGSVSCCRDCIILNKKREEG